MQRKSLTRFDDQASEITDISSEPSLNVFFQNLSFSINMSTLDVSPAFDFGVRLGLVFIAQAAALSLIAVVCVLIYIGVRL